MGVQPIEKIGVGPCTGNPQPETHPGMMHGDNYPRDTLSIGDPWITQLNKLQVRLLKVEMALVRSKITCGAASHRLLNRFASRTNRNVHGEGIQDTLELLTKWIQSVTARANKTCRNVTKNQPPVKQSNGEKTNPRDGKNSRNCKETHQPHPQFLPYVDHVEFFE
eukprot:Filipodium_phascolosomae@DN2446_c0_g1_i2.p1